MSADFTNFESEISDLLDGVFVTKNDGVSDEEYDTNSVSLTPLISALPKFSLRYMNKTFHKVTQNTSTSDIND